MFAEDKVEIAELMTGWMYRDLGNWDAMRTLFHPGGVIAVSWFEGLFSEFVDRSMMMGKSGLTTKHIITFPQVTLAGPKAIAETNAVIIGENSALGIGCSAHTRFYDLVEKRDGCWKIVNRRAIYDMASFSYPRGMYETDTSILDRHPGEYAPLAYVLEKSGYPVTRIFPTRGSAMENEIRNSGAAWLAEA